jgi:pyrroloquinoline quinone biosynthesis protein B
MKLHTIISCLILYGCVAPESQAPAVKDLPEGPFLAILGNVQDGGSPHPNCQKTCCRAVITDPAGRRKVVSLGIVDPESKQNWLVEATPDLPVQLMQLRQFAPFKTDDVPDGILLTHAHMGHYSGLMYLGKEAMNTKNVPVYAGNRMHAFLSGHGPWSQLVTINNIALRQIKPDSAIALSSNIHVTALQVPHRDEFSETFGYIISGPDKKALFIPDIDKWEQWKVPVEAMIALVDYALIDATFYDAQEINNRDISEIPHPFVIESMARFKNLPAQEKNKIYFIHFNHSNPLLDEKSAATKTVLKAGFNIAREAMVLPL